MFIAINLFVFISSRQHAFLKKKLSVFNFLLKISKIELTNKIVNNTQIYLKAYAKLGPHFFSIPIGF